MKSLSIPPNTPAKELFCKTYWKNVLKDIDKIPKACRFDFSDANDSLMLLSYNCNLDALIKNNDLAQKVLARPIKNPLTLWRGIANPANTLGNKPNYIKFIFQKCINLKKGDILYMPEYSFWTDSKEIALQCAHNSSILNQPSILYELRLPEGTNIYEKIFPIFKRCSKFLCKENNKVTENSTVYNHIKLKLL